MIIDIDKEEWVAFNLKTPRTGQKVVLRQIITTEAIWDGHEFFINDASFLYATKIPYHDIKLEWCEIK